MTYRGFKVLKLKNYTKLSKIDNTMEIAGCKIYARRTCPLDFTVVAQAKPDVNFGIFSSCHTKGKSNRRYFSSLANKA